MENPGMYSSGRLRTQLNPMRMAHWMSRTFIDSGLIFFITLTIMRSITPPAGSTTLGAGTVDLDVLGTTARLQCRFSLE